MQVLLLILAGIYFFMQIQIWIKSHVGMLRKIQV